MKKERKITKQQYERAKQIVSKYEAQFSLSFVRGRFSLDDLEIKHYTISVPKLTEEVFDDGYCTVLYHSITDKIHGCDWTNVDDAGHLTICFRSLTITDEIIECVLECLNAL